MNPPSPINVSHHLFLGLKEREQPTGLHADLEFVGKKSFKEPDNWDQLSDETKENLRLHHNWVNMLTVVPGISDAKARRIASVYPSAHALMDEYLDERVSERTRQLLLQDLFRENSGGGGGGVVARGKVHLEVLVVAPCCYLNQPVGKEQQRWWEKGREGMPKLAHRRRNLSRPTNLWWRQKPCVR